MSESLTARLGSFVNEFSFADIPEDALSLVRSAFADTVAVIMAGIDEDAVRIVHQHTIEADSGVDARVCLTDVRASSAAAALIGGTAAHALDYDDQSLSGHPSAVLVPVILAEGERLGSSGRDLAAAYVVGYEVWAELIGRNTGYHAKGWHPTSVFGTIGAAASAASLNRLSTGETIRALAIAASQASGLASNFGTMTKPLHAGLAARNGVVSAQLAKAGLTASTDIFDSPGGYLGAFASSTAPDLSGPQRLGTSLYILNHRLCVKRYPTCYFMHRSFEATTQMLADTKTTAEQIACVEVTMGRGQTTVLTHDRPQTGLEAKFSGHFAIAAAAVVGRMGLPELTDNFVQRPDIQAFFPKVRLIPVDEYDPRDPAHSPSDSVRVILKDGRLLDSGPIATVKGHANDPLSPAELWQKFQECTAHTHTPMARKSLFDALMQIDSLPSARALPSSGGRSYMAMERRSAGEMIEAAV
jgi:2-methylcitrate dehydratase PrpD